ncbi:MAG: anti-sigma factor family protein [Anaeromyxobacteraceae bacterium]
MTIDPTEATPAMDCAELERALDAWIDGELDAPEDAGAERHVAACERCREHANAARQVRRAIRVKLREAMGGGSASDGLRERIHVALVAERRTPLWRRLVPPLPLAGVVALAVGVAVAAALLVARGDGDALVDEAVAKHARDLPLEVTSASVGQESVHSWFAGKLDFNAVPPRFRAGDVRLVGARLSHIQDRPAAYVRYDLPHGHLGLFILEDAQRRFGASGRAVRVGPATVRLLTARGFHVAVWRRDALVYSLVSDMDEADLARLVETADGLTDR